MTRLAPDRLIVAALAALTALPPPAAARHRQHRRVHATRATPPPAAAPAPSQPPLDDLYRRRGYGVGGPVFGGDTAFAGTCADLRFAEPSSCGRGYGLYGNGLGTRFGR